MASSLKKHSVLLIGDSMLDEYVYAEEVCTALDAPVPEAEFHKASLSFGGAGLVASNIVALGGKVHFLTIVGKDQDAAHYQKFEHPNLQKILFVDSTRKTTLKSRWYVDGKKILQVNKVDNHYISTPQQHRILADLKKVLPLVDVVVISDPQHGMLPKALVQKIIAAAHASKKNVYVDTQISHRPGNFHFYRGADAIFLNEAEARAALSEFDARRGRYVLEELQKVLRIQNVIVKLGARGSMGLIGERYYRVPAHRVAIVDACGAGDAFLAAFAVYGGLSPYRRMQTANVWAALSTTVHGTVPPQRSRFVSALKNLRT